MKIEITEVPQQQRGECPSELGFGGVFSDHMYTGVYDEDQGWHDAKIGAFHNLTLHPAASVLHYGQEIFEGLKAYRRADGGINLFRPEQNARRFNRSAQRMVMPAVEEAFHLEAIRSLVKTDQAWVPTEPAHRFI